MALSINEDDEMLEDIMENGNQDDDDDDDIPEEETSFVQIPKSGGRPPRLKRQVRDFEISSSRL